jgi:hypothetical protein
MSGKDITMKAGSASDGGGGSFIIESGKPSGANTGSTLSFKTWASSGDANATERLSINSSGQITINSAFTLPTSDGTDGQVLTTDGLGTVTWENGGGGSGDVSSSSNLTDNAILRGDGGTKNVQDSTVYIDDNGNLGIGTSSPTQKLHLVGDSLFEGDTEIEGGLQLLDQNKVYTIDNIRTDLWSNVGTLTESDENFGLVVDISKDGLTIAIAEKQTGFVNSYLRMYKLINGTWTQIGSTIDSVGYITYLSLNGNGTVVAFGMPISPDGSGRAKVYEYINNTWTQKGSTFSGGSGDSLGTNILLNSKGNILALSEPGFTYDSIADRGRIRIFSYINNDWSVIGTLYGEAASDEAGYLGLNSVGNIISIGSVNNNSNLGQIEVYQYTGGSWSQIGSDIAGAATGDNFSYFTSMSADGYTIAIGSVLNDAGGTDKGELRVFEYRLVTNAEWISASVVIATETQTDVGTGTERGTGPEVYSSTTKYWIQKGTDINGINDNDRLGISCKISSNGNFCLVGAYQNTGGNGFASLYEYRGNDWVKIEDFSPGGTAEEYGFSVSMNADTSSVVIGAPAYNSGAGKVYIYKQGNYFSNVGIGTNSPTQALDIVGSIRTSNNLYMYNTTNSLESRFTSTSNELLLQVGTALTSNSAKDFAIVNMYNTSATSNRKIMFKADGKVGIGTNSPDQLLHVEGLFYAKNYGWNITRSSGGNATYSAGEVFFGSNADSSYYFQSVVGYNGANTGQWNSTAGTFSIPEKGLYLINLYIFINGATSGRWFVFYHRNSGGGINYSQYCMFEPNNLSSDNVRSFTTSRIFAAGDYFEFQHASGGNITLYLGGQHTSMSIYKLA